MTGNRFSEHREDVHSVDSPKRLTRKNPAEAGLIVSKMGPQSHPQNEEGGNRTPRHYSSIPPLNTGHPRQEAEEARIHWKTPDMVEAVFGKA
jgi:hypothetical protein